MEYENNFWTSKSGDFWVVQTDSWLNHHLFGYQFNSSALMGCCTVCYQHSLHPAQLTEIKKKKPYSSCSEHKIKSVT